MPTKTPKRLAAIIEEKPRGVRWHDQQETAKLLAIMSPTNLAKVQAARRACRPMVGTLYRRTRPNNFGGRSVRAEVRFDDVAGCLRTPSGGSSRQKILVVHGDEVRSRLMSAREAARLMGLPDTYKLPDRYSDAYHVAGDGVAVPVVRYLAASILEPIIVASREEILIAAE